MNYLLSPCPYILLFLSSPSCKGISTTLIKIISSPMLLLSHFSHFWLCVTPIPGILQARTLEWVAISFSKAWKWKVKGWLKTVDTNGWMASMYVQTHWSTSASHQLVEYTRWRFFEEESNVWRSLLSRERSSFPTTSRHGSLEISLSSQSFQWWLWPMRVSTSRIIPLREGSYACSIPETLMEPGLWVGMQRIFYIFNRWHRGSL